MSIEICSERDLSAPAAAVWALIGDFAAVDAWMPGVRVVAVERYDGVERRTCDTALGRFREQAVALGAMSCTYVITDGPLPVSNYEATLAVVGRPDARQCKVVWRSTFSPRPETGETDARRLVEGIHRAGLGALVKRFGASASVRDGRG